MEDDDSPGTPLAHNRQMRSDRWNKPQQLTALATALGLGLGALALRQSRRRRAFDFSGRSVLITGGSRGLGLVIARLLAAEGARITLVARDADELDRARQILQPAGADISCIVGDVSKPADAERMVREVVERTRAD